MIDSFCTLTEGNGHTSAQTYSAPCRADLPLTSDEEPPVTEINLTCAL